MLLKLDPGLGRAGRTGPGESLASLPSCSGMCHSLPGGKDGESSPHNSVTSSMSHFLMQQKLCKRLCTLPLFKALVVVVVVVDLFFFSFKFILTLNSIPVSVVNLRTFSGSHPVFDCFACF